MNIQNFKDEFLSSEYFNNLIETYGIINVLFVGSIGNIGVFNEESDIDLAFIVDNAINKYPSMFSKDDSIDNTYTWSLYSQERIVWTDVNNNNNEHLVHWKFFTIDQLFGCNGSNEFAYNTLIPLLDSSNCLYVKNGYEWLPDFYSKNYSDIIKFYGLKIFRDFSKLKNQKDTIELTTKEMVSNFDYYFRKPFYMELLIIYMMGNKENQAILDLAVDHHYKIKNNIKYTYAEKLSLIHTSIEEYNKIIKDETDLNILSESIVTKLNERKENS